MPTQQTDKWARGKETTTIAAFNRNPEEPEKRHNNSQPATKETQKSQPGHGLFELAVNICLTCETYFIGCWPPPPQSCGQSS